MIHNSDVKLKISGCAVKRGAKFFETTFSVGSKAWIKKKAEKGELESIYIKKIYRTVPENYFYQKTQPAITYVDTLNRVWTEEELTWEEDAIDWAKLHWNIIKKYAEDQLINNCPPEPPCGS